MPKLKAVKKKTAETAPVADVPPLRLEWRSPAELAENPSNWRRHPEAQIAALTDVIGEVGWAGACLFNERTGRLIDGHARRKVALEQGTEKVPVLIGGWDEAQEKKILATLDPLASLAEADGAALAELLKGVQTESQAVADMLTRLAEDSGVIPAEVTPGAGGDEFTPDETKPCRVSKGDLWVIGGKHRVICADCREPETWSRLLVSAKANGVFTSPPYAEQRKERYGGVPVDQYVEWWEAVQACVRANLADDGSFFVNIKPHCDDGERVLYVMELVLAMKRRWGWRYVDELAWTHQGMPGKFGDRLKNQFEPVHHFAVGKCKTRFADVRHESDKVPTFSVGSNAEMQGVGDPLRGRLPGDALPGNVIRVGIGNPKEFTGHAAAFPVALPEFFVRAFSDPGDVWADPFLGSGTTLIAAHRNGRVGVGVELLPEHVEIILQRAEAEGLSVEKSG